MDKIPANKARQGRWGAPILLVLVIGLALAAAIWFALEIYGEAIDTQSAGEPGAVQTGETGEQPNANP